MIKITGLDDVRKKLNELSKKADSIKGQHEVSINDLMTVSFLKKHTQFSSVQELFNASGFKIDSKEELEKIPKEEWDKYICSISSFNSWQEMIEGAGKEWIAGKIGF